jgi:hypothetical protein
MTGASKNTIVKLLEDAGEAFSAYQDQMFHDLPCKRLPGISGTSESDSDAKPSRSRQGRGLSPSLQRGIGQDIVHQRPPTGLRGVV